MKNKILFLGAVISACVLSSACAGNQMNADSRNPNLPNGGRKCNALNGDCPNRIESVNPNNNFNYNDTGIKYSNNRSGGYSYNNSNSYNNGYGYNNENGNSAPAAKKLQTSSIESFKGTVTSVSRDRQTDGRQFVQIKLDTNDGEKTIMVGPASFVDQSRVKLLVGDKVTVKGFRIGANGNEVIMAQSIDKNGNVLQLLNEQRQPLWQQQNGGQYRQYTFRRYQ